MLLLARCGGDEAGGGKPGVGGGGGSGGADASKSIDTPWDAWRALKEALATSPDNLPARALAVVESKDPELIFEFVRDNVATLPSPSWVATGVRWGVRGTLRGGAGTPRERAELLASLYSQAGFVAEVVTGAPAAELAAPSAVHDVYARTIDLPFVPGKAPSPFATWVEALGDPGAAPKILDENSKQSQALAAAIGAVLPANAAAKPIAISGTEAVPLVKVTVGGSVRYANPLLPSAKFGTAYVDAPIAANPADPAWKVDVALSVTRSDAPTERIEVARGSFDLDLLVGRQLLVGFQPPEPLEGLLGRKLDQVGVYTPLIAPSGVDLSAAEVAKTVVTGSTFTLGGDVVEVTDQGEVRMNGVPLDTSAVDPSAVAKVESVSVDVNAATFPRVELAVSALDANGKPVPGLAASAFTLNEDGATHQLVMRQNSGELRVLFLLDQSASQPAAFTDPNQAATLGTSLGQALLQAFPSAKVQVKALGGAAPTLDGFTATTPAEVGEAFKSAYGVFSPVYRALADATHAAPSVTILFCDGDIQDDPAKLDALRSVAATGAPVLAIATAANVADIKKAAMDAVASLTGGSSLDAGTLGDLAPVNAAIQAIVQKRALSPYRFTYHAPTAGASERNIVLQAGKGTASGKYQVPASPQAPRALSGIYLELSVGSSSKVTRKLAGWDADVTPDGPVAQSVLDEVRAALLGGVTLSLEGRAPGFGVRMSDLLSSLLSTEEAFKAAASGSFPALIEAWQKHPPVTVPKELAALHCGLPPLAGTALHEQAVRAVLCQYAPSATGHRRVDILPWTRVSTFGAKDQATAFQATLRATLKQAVAEQALFDTSTASLLSGKALSLVPAGPVAAADLSFVPAAEREAFARLLNAWPSHHRVVASDGSTQAFWAVDVDTGSTIGVLPDGTGGGSSSGCQFFKDMKTYYDCLGVLMLILEMFGGPTGMSIFLLIGKMTAVSAIKAAMCFTDGPFPSNFGDPNAIACAYAGNGVSGMIKLAADLMGLKNDLLMGSEFLTKQLDFLKGFMAGKGATAVTEGLGCPPLIPKC